jgi:hypothetical protein
MFSWPHVTTLKVPSLFQDNFDYQDIRKDFVHGILTSDLLMKNIYCYVAKEGYAARVKDTKSYDSIRYICPIERHVSIATHFLSVRISFHGGRSHWFRMTTTQLVMCTNIYAGTNTSQRTTPWFSPGKPLPTSAKKPSCQLIAHPMTTFFTGLVKLATTLLSDPPRKSSTTPK